MEHIHTLYHNDFGISFQWKRNVGKNIHKIQLVFRETGVFLSKEELIDFKKEIHNTLSYTRKCNDCNNLHSCRSLLLETPVPQLTFAVNKNDLLSLNDLIEGTLFQLGFNRILNDNYISTN